MTMVGVVGLGTMGLGIAQVFAQAGAVVLATDAVEAAREGARDRLAGALDGRVKAGKMTAEERDAILGRLVVVEGPASMGAAELVVEAVVEDLSVKRALLAALEEVVAPGAVLATNTSSLSVARIAEGVRHPERVVGLHFFNPAPVQRLVELVRHGGTSEAALAVARRLAEAAGKVVVEAPDTPGFIVNRCARPFYGEALALLEEGRTAAEIDAAVMAAGYRIGPFALIDLIGADVHLAATRAVWEGMGRHPRYRVFAALEAQVASGALGRKAGRGFVTAAGEAPGDAGTIVERIEATLANEAGWLLSEGSVTTEAVDAATRLALSWPRGPFEMLAARGRGAVRARLEALEARAPAHLRGRYAPAPILMEGA
ncbi:3-hydroxybutyryl-CoA dehydrogenase, 3-hydroxyacyl-CoA dehydrogenase [Rubellimicrobium mesophilum DSM 19309]|uniref:3-hydroxybutyryl-CoA dehydrogenase, 3-hydroxyacyl-CoA dehydrogenase n=1 Tax=Rubellimicrobium mesophilum DSM 19309 TaxID=442562 RepID=A0A017HR62_9RHOB|nr:3-hydroxyacyl-CoA dehydrogenase NAD-binding domain-containing protein [Rubellimicrobium mesophilum]EYD76972.1 3-hydroxybutyryl-CoA dehydrogenase, 3-hydroxyacyl-CoA dehydrogenase [Rubellimicrobium mesophilum DSM 19309]